MNYYPEIQKDHQFLTKNALRKKEAKEKRRAFMKGVVFAWIIIYFILIIWAIFKI